MRYQPPPTNAPSSPEFPDFTAESPASRGPANRYHLDEDSTFRRAGGSSDSSRIPNVLQDLGDGAERRGRRCLLRLHQRDQNSGPQWRRPVCGGSALPCLQRHSPSLSFTLNLSTDSPPLINYGDHLLRCVSASAHFAPFLRAQTNIKPGPVLGGQVTPSTSGPIYLSVHRQTYLYHIPPNSEQGRAI